LPPGTRADLDVVQGDPFDSHDHASPCVSPRSQLLVSDGRKKVLAPFRRHFSRPSRISWYSLVLDMSVHARACWSFRAMSSPCASSSARICASFTLDTPLCRSPPWRPPRFHTVATRPVLDWSVRRGG